MKRITAVVAAAALVPLLAGEPGPAPDRPPLDQYGDPLPPGATARFGSLRWRLPDAINAVAVSPDGKQAAAVNMHGAVAVWETDGGRLLHEFRGSKSGEACLAFSPDGALLATGGRFDNLAGTGDFRVRLWDLKTGKLRAETPAQNGAVSRLVFSSDGRTLFSAGFDQPVTAWKVPGCEKLRAFPTESETFHDVAVSPDDRWVAVTNDDQKTIKVWSFDGDQKLFTVRSQWNYFTGLYYTPDGKSLVTLEQGGVIVWDASSGKPRAIFPLEADSFREGRLSPDGKRMALFGGIGDKRRGVDWLDLATGKRLDAWKGRSKEPIRTLAFSRDGKTAVTGDWGAVRVWDAPTGKLIQEPTGPDDIFYATAFSADGKTALAAGYRCLCFLDGKTLEERARIPVVMDRHDYPDYRFSVALSSDGATAAFLGSNDDIVVVDSRNPDKPRTLRRPGWPPASLAFSADGTRIYALGHEASGLRVWDLGTGKEEAPFDETLRPWSNLSVARRAEKLAVVVRGDELRCRLWDLRTGKEQAGLKMTDRGDRIMLSEDGALLAVYEKHNHVSIYDVAKQAERCRIKMDDAGWTIAWAFSDDGRYLVTSHEGGVIRTWNTADGRKVGERRGSRGGAGIVTLAVSPEDGGLVSGCTECSLLRWRKDAWQGK